ncbi:MAG: hypothetical protein IT426_03120 [Pirellulales bacterium]|nr:hypothetical protein [Pirellulales bacterium]
MSHKSNSRRGILLLLILALLAMFGMVAVAFVVLSSQTMRSAKSMQRQQQAYHPPQNDVHEAAMQVFRGTLNPVSKMGPHSLLEDMYGNGTFSRLSTGAPLMIAGAQTVCGGQLIEITTNAALPADFENIKRRIGSVITIISANSPAYGLSTRIVGVNPTNGNPQLLAFPNILPANIPALLAGRLFVINDMPFSGTGYGFNPTTGKLDASNRFGPLALQPFAANNFNLLGGANEDYDAADYQNPLLATPPIPGSALFFRGASNPLPVTVNRILPSMHRPALVNYWYQNLFFDYVLSGIDASSDPTNRWRTIFKPVEAYKAGIIVKPSSPLPPRWPQAPTPEQIVGYILELKRNIMARPLTDDHPYFDGSNPTSKSSYYDTTLTDAMGNPAPKKISWECGDIYPPPFAGTTPQFIQPPRWDVDADGDGIPDSNWIDIGLPIRSTIDGRKYKPLVAVYCLDMDGRLNLNAHGNLAQTEAGYYPLPSTPPDSVYPINSFAGPMLPQTIRGRGFGPAEINLAGILPIAYPNPLGATFPPINMYKRLLGDSALGIEGRYGSDGVPGDCVDGMPKFFTSLTGLQPANIEQRKYNDYLSANKWFQFDGIRDSVAGGSLGANSAAAVDGVLKLRCGELPDPSGRSVLGVDPAGRPILQSMIKIVAANKSPNVNYYNVPYELNLGPQTARGLLQTSQASDQPDNPFSVNELERILRPFDLDSQSQATRLAALTSPNPLLPGGSLLGNHRHEITTESWDVPVYTAGLPNHLIKQVQDDLVTSTAIPGPNFPLLTVPDWYKPTKVTDLLKAYLYYQLRHPPAGAAYGPLEPEDDLSTTPPTKGARSVCESMVNSLTTAQLLALFPPELLAGLKMDLNHPFPGHAEPLTNRNYNLAVLWKNSGLGNQYGQIWFGQMPEMPFPDPGLSATPANPVIYPNAPFAARQLYARYLYILALLLRDRDPTTGAETQAQWFTEPTLNDAQKEELTKRRIAQWAINAACYKTNDSIMVPFEYHTNPFNIKADTSTTPATYTFSGWQYFYDTATKQWRNNLDGAIDRLLPTGQLPAASDDNQQFRGLVWGCKPAELILTETLAFHNRRIADTAHDKNTHTKVDPDPAKDKDYDQSRIPQGSAFFELYCTRDLHGATPPSDLYDLNTGRLNLGQLAPPDAVNNIPSYPVWRVAITRSTLDSSNPNKAYNDVKNRLAGPNPTPPPKPDSASLEPEQFSTESAANSVTRERLHFSLLKGTSDPKVEIERIVWFASLPPTAQHLDNDRIYWNRSTAPGSPVLLDRGRYAVVGPRAFTRLGLTTDKSDPANYPLGKLSNQTITLDPNVDPDLNTAYVTDLGGLVDPNSMTPGATPLLNGNRVKAPLAIIAAGGGQGTSWPTGWASMNNTAPNGIGISISEPLFSAPNYYPEPTEPAPAAWPATDRIWEWYGDPLMQDITKYFPDTPLDTEPNMPLVKDGIAAKTGTTPPAANSNPSTYKTVFLQRLANPSAPYDPTVNPYLTVDWMPIDLTVFNGEDIKETTDNGDAKNFASRQRGKNTTPAADVNYFNIWASLSDHPAENTLANNLAGSGSYLDYNVVQSLGYLNKAFWFPTPLAPDPANPWITSVNPTPRPAEYYGDPLVKPFPWLPWFGRPYVSEMELMMVPSSHPARLLWEFKPCTAATKNYNPTKAAEQPFPQLLNFLQSQNTVGTNPMNQFHRILDYVGVPSWYAGTEVQANPTLSSNMAGPDAQHWFHAPYNRISTYREPGRINLNTIYSSNVFSGLMNGVNAPNWAQFVKSRRGYITPSNNILDQSPDPYPPPNPTGPCPTEFFAPFRSSGSATWVPQGVPPWISTPFSPRVIIPPEEIQSTILRASNHLTPVTPFFQQSTSVGVVDDPLRNPYFHYADLMRMANLTTTRSNVYAVWITVGYFEVLPVPPNLPNNDHPWLKQVELGLTPVQFQQLLQQIYPDGYELGQELGSDTGEITRHRGFYIFDRSIPVGFERGQDLNVEKAILLKRFIE